MSEGATSKKILIAEDDKFLASAYRLKLEKSGFEVKVAQDGSEVFKILPEFIPDLILLDLVMPVRDGFSVLTELKVSPEYKEIPVIIASNLGQKEDIDRGITLGAAGYIVKSDISIQDLITKVNAILLN